MMNFRGDFIASPGTQKIKWPLYPVQLRHALGSDKYCWLSVTFKDYCYAWDVLSHFQEPLRALFLVNKTSPLLNQKLAGNLTDINVLLEKEFPSSCLRMLLSGYMKHLKKKSQLFYGKEKLKESRKKEQFISASIKSDVCIVHQVVYTLFGASKSQRKDKEYILE